MIINVMYDSIDNDINWKENDAVDRLAKIIRIITIPPVLAAALAITLFSYDAALIGSTAQFYALLFFLTILPALAYFLQPFLPLYRDKGRAGQRKLAFIASAAGYSCGLIFALVTSATKTVRMIYWTYFVSVLMLTVFNKATPWRASGHACGVVGPISLMVSFIGPQTLPVVLVFALMAWASLRTKRHTPVELILGGIDSVFAFLLVLFAFHAFHL